MCGRNESKILRLIHGKLLYIQKNPNQIKAKQISNPKKSYTYFSYHSTRASWSYVTYSNVSKPTGTNARRSRHRPLSSSSLSSAFQPFSSAYSLSSCSARRFQQSSRTRRKSRAWRTRNRNGKGRTNGRASSRFSAASSVTSGSRLLFLPILNILIPRLINYLMFNHMFYIYLFIHFEQPCSILLIF